MLLTFHRQKLKIQCNAIYTKRIMNLQTDPEDEGSYVQNIGNIARFHTE
jgi:hypothetical protein